MATYIAPSVVNASTALATLKADEANTVNVAVKASHKGNNQGKPSAKIRVSLDGVLQDEVAYAWEDGPADFHHVTLVSIPAGTSRIKVESLNENADATGITLSITVAQELVAG